tara:strand:+ start:4859 stop:5758 length:900 start_codon:yes stop_codon:yes gene_type:complete
MQYCNWEKLWRDEESENLKAILGIGTAGSNIANSFKKFKAYDVYTVSNQNQKNTKFNLKLPTFDHPEEYESHVEPKLKGFMAKIFGPVDVFLCGANCSTAISLRALKHLHDRGQKINVFYVEPEIEVLGKIQTLQERASRGILQQYARSGLFESITILSNKSVEVFLDSVTIMNYYKKLNECISSTCHMINTFKKSESVVSTFSKLPESCKIKTIGVSSCDDPRDEMFYPFDEEKEVRYYFGISRSKLEQEEGLHRKIMDKVTNRMKEGITVSYSIIPTEYEEDYVYVEYYSSKIQENT